MRNKIARIAILTVISAGMLSASAYGQYGYDFYDNFDAGVYGQQYDTYGLYDGNRPTIYNDIEPGVYFDVNPNLDLYGPQGTGYANPYDAHGLDNPYTGGPYDGLGSYRYSIDWYGWD